MMGAGWKYSTPREKSHFKSQDIRYLKDKTTGEEVSSTRRLRACLETICPSSSARLLYVELIVTGSLKISNTRLCA